MLDFEQRVAIVTGAGQGMGREHARTLASRGARVVVSDISERSAAETVRLIVEDGGAAVLDVHDVTTDAAAIVQTAIEAFGQLDIVVSNAGILRAEPFADQVPDDFWTIFNVSFKGTVDITRAAWPHLVASGSGRVILISSSGILGNPTASAYGAAKAAVWGLANTLAMEGESVGVQVTTIMPSAWTSMTDGAFDNAAIVSTMRDSMGPEHVAAFAAFLAHQDTTVHDDFLQVSGGRAGRLVLAALPRVQAPESSPEGWAAVASELEVDGDLVARYRTTSEQFMDELLAVNPDLAETLTGVNPADITT
jgi:NAD(P)-dependent dehydrogenase (short-subunit alcohol dehydrogenase family)